MSSHAADRIIDVLIEAGITHFFGIPGGSTMELYKALHGREAEIRPIVPRDEQTASCMAEMYGKCRRRFPTKRSSALTPATTATG